MAEITFSKQKTFEGFTYKPGTHEVSEDLFYRLKATFPVVTSKPKKAKRAKKKKAVKSEVKPVTAGVEEVVAVEVSSSVESAWSGSKEVEAMPPELDSVSVLELKGLSQSVLDALAARFTSVDKLQKASDEEILAIPGIGKTTLKKIREIA